jgi:hypothetical protein
MSRIAIGKEKDMGPTKQAEPTRIRLTYDEPADKITREPAGKFKVGELLEFYSSDGKPVKVELYPKSAYQPNTYDETRNDKQPVRVIKVEPVKAWCYFEESRANTTGAPIWSKKYGFDSDPST